MPVSSTRMTVLYRGCADLIRSPTNSRAYAFSASSTRCGVKGMW